MVPKRNNNSDENQHWNKIAMEHPQQFAQFLTHKLKQVLQKREADENFKSFLIKSHHERMSNPSYSVMGDDPGDDDDVRFFCEIVFKNLIYFLLIFFYMVSLLSILN